MAFSLRCLWSLVVLFFRKSARKNAFDFLRSDTRVFSKSMTFESRVSCSSLWNTLFVEMPGCFLCFIVDTTHWAASNQETPAVANWYNTQNTASMLCQVPSVASYSRAAKAFSCGSRFNVQPIPNMRTVRLPSSCFFAIAKFNPNSF